jgi:hypothetical protein
MNTIALDYETFYSKDYSIRDLGNWRYCHDAEFDPYMLSIFDGERKWVGHPEEFNWDALRGSRIIAHNAAFDGSVTDRLIEDGLVPPWVRAELPWQCTANLSSHTASVRSLADSIKVLYGRNVSKGMRDYMKGKHWPQAIADGKAKDLQDYAISDVVECHRLWTDHSPKWSQFEQDLSSLTMKQCARGVAINTELLDEYRSVLQEVIYNLVKSFPWVARGAKPTSPIAIAEQCAMAGIPAPPVKTHDEEGFVLWESTYGPRFPWVYGAGQWRSLGKLLSSLDTVKERLRPDGTIDFSLLYFGGHTGRWSGGGSGFNLQNLRKVPLYLKDRHMVDPPTGLTFDDMELWVEQATDYALDIRKILVPRAGKKFIMADLAQIEPRVLAKLTDNRALLDLIKSGMNIYEAFARTSSGWTGGVLKKENPDMYKLSKIQVLGLGYGCGWEKFISIAAGYGISLTEETSRELVDKFRSGTPGIPEFWATLDAAFRRSVGGNFSMDLPSGRSLNFRDIRCETRSKKNSKTGKFEKRTVYVCGIGLDREESYGGKLSENITQAISRDVFGTHLLELEKQIGDVIFHVHDEAIVETDLDVKVADVEHVMAKSPDWWNDLPVEAEGKEGTCYGE